MAALRRVAGFQAAILFVCVFLAWSVELVDRVAYGGSLERYGIQPRTLTGLWGILVAPLLHVGWVHLTANTVPFVVLGWLVMLRKISDFIVVTALAIVVGGLGVWLLGAPNSIHVGASGLIFGYLGYLLARGYFERSIWAVLLGVVALVLYGGVLWGGRRKPGLRDRKRDRCNQGREHGARRVRDGDRGPSPGPTGPPHPG